MFKKIKKLPAKERYLVIVVGAFVLGIIVFQLFISGGIRRGKTLQRIIAEKENELAEMRQMCGEYNEMKKEMNDVSKRLSKRDGDFAIFSFLEQTATDLQIRKHIAYMKPSFSSLGEDYAESIVEVKLNAVTLNQINKYLFEIEKTENLLNIKRLDIKASSQNPGYLDVVFEVSTLVTLKGQVMTG